MIADEDDWREVPATLTPWFAPLYADAYSSIGLLLMQSRGGGNDGGDVLYR